MCCSPWGRIASDTPEPREQHHHVRAVVRRGSVRGWTPLPEPCCLPPSLPLPGAHVSGIRDWGGRQGARASRRGGRSRDGVASRALLRAGAAHPPSCSLSWGRFVSLPRGSIYSPSPVPKGGDFLPS